VIVLDTHAWLWWIGEEERLSAKARRAIEGASQVGIPSICCFEATYLAYRGRVSLAPDPVEWVLCALQIQKTRLLALTPAVALRAAALPDSFPRDPIDRLITATAIENLAPLVTRDEAIGSSGVLRTIW
jgi:PIN domain nuclease of toxin-antitoxin system